MNYISILPLGAGCEVGRSCIILTVNNKKIMLDCGLLIGVKGQSSLPLFDKINAYDLSMILITHAHLDHCGALPYYLARTKYSKRVYMTQPTKDIYRYLLKDTIKVNEQPLITSYDVDKSMRRITVVNFGVEFEFEGIKVIPFCAGHIVGAAMFLIEVDGLRVLYTGDYSCEEGRYIMKAEIPDAHVDVLIVESTYGIRKHEPSDRRYARFTQYVEKIVTRKGKCLLPVFSAGRAEELLHILNDHWEMNSEKLARYKMYYTCSLIDQLKKVYERYIGMLSKKVRERFEKEGVNPFDFKYIHYLKSNDRLLEEYRTDQGLVVMCTPGMLQSGQSRTLFDRWCHDSNNGLILTGYCVEGSLACGLKKGDKVKKANDEQVEVRMDVTYISFSAHADCKYTTEFIKKVYPSYVVLVHGSQKNATDLQKHLEKEFPQIRKICCPKNLCEEKFEIEKKLKIQVAGSLKQRIEKYTEEAKQKMQEENRKDIVLYKFEGVVVNTGDQVVLVDQKEKTNFFPYHQSIKINQRMIVKYGGSPTLAELLAANAFGSCSPTISDGKYAIIIKGAIKLTILYPNKTACLEFYSSPRNDIMADQFAFLLSNIPDDPEWDPFSGDIERDFVQATIQVIREYYPDSVIQENMIEVRLKDHIIAIINLKTKHVQSEDLSVRLRFEALIDSLSL